VSTRLDLPRHSEGLRIAEHVSLVQSAHRLNCYGLSLHRLKACAYDQVFHLQSAD